MKEIEIKLKYKNKGKIISLIKKQGFSLNKNKVIRDIYFGINQSTMSNKNQLIRIRHVKNEFAELTIKDKLKENRGIWTRRELNVPIIDVNNMIMFLKAIGYKIIRENSSKREIWNKNGIKIEFISYTIPTKLNFIEIEADNNNSINKLVDLLGNEVSMAGEKLFEIFDKKS